MSAWDAMTWATLLVLGPGAVIVFAAVIRDGWRLLREDRSRRARERGRPSRDRDAGKRR